MLFIYKKSLKPIAPWDALRHGGINNLTDAEIKSKGKYLVLLNVDIIQREGAWHYIFHFDARESLAMSALAQSVGKTAPYPDDMDWDRWLGFEYQVIAATIRENILSMPPDESHPSTVITNMREIRQRCPLPVRTPDEWRQLARLPQDVILALPA